MKNDQSNTEFQKGIHPNNKRILVFRDCYANSFSYLKNLVSTLKSDFPDASDEEIQFTEFDNIHRKGVICLIFNNAQNLPVPNRYKELPIDLVRTRPL